LLKNNDIMKIRCFRIDHQVMYTIMYIDLMVKWMLQIH